jgi:Na+/melibiose symporter-like transporter
MFPAILIGIGLAVFQQLSGINTVFNYAPKIFQSIGASQDDQLLQTVFIGGVNLIFTIAAILLVDKLGRKPLMLFGFGGLAVLYLVIVQLLASSSATVTYYLLAAIGVYAMSLAPVTWVLISDPVLFEKFKDATFYFYAAICLAGFIFVLFKVKETKGQTLEELENTMNFH